MEENKLKNTVVLKNLPSNLIEEAIIIFKANKKVKNLKNLDRNNNEQAICENKELKKELIIKEAELVISSYIDKIEKSKKTYNLNKNLKYERLKSYAFISTIIIILESILLIFN